MTIPNRKDFRERLAVFLESGISDYQSVYDHAVEDLQGETPVASVLSAGSGRSDLSTFYFWVHHWVLYSSEDDSWTEENAEDMMDDLEYKLAQLIMLNRQTAHWNYLDYDGVSGVDVIPLGGTPYLHEAFRIRMEVFG